MDLGPGVGDEVALSGVVHFDRLQGRSLIQAGENSHTRFLVNFSYNPSIWDFGNFGPYVGMYLDGTLGVRGFNGSDVVLSMESNPKF